MLLLDVWRQKIVPVDWDISILSVCLNFVDHTLSHTHTHTSPLCSACVCNNGLCLKGINTAWWYSMENRWPVSWVYHTEMHIQKANQTSEHKISSSREFARMPSCYTCWRVESLSRSMFRGVADRAKPIEPRFVSAVHMDWFWHLANAPAFSRMGEHRHATSSCGLGRSPNVFPLPSSATQMFWLISRCNSWRFGFSGLVVLLLAIWLDSERIYCSVYLRSDCHLSGAIEPLWAELVDADSMYLYGSHDYMCTVNLHVLQITLYM